jgi:hypothetical protein
MGATTMDMATNQYDRRIGDLGNSVEFGHVNVRVPNQLPATAFYISGLGLTRDPYLMTGIDNMWVNSSNAQFHLPRGEPQVLRGHTGLVVPSLKDLLWRLDRVGKELAGTQFRFENHGEHVDAWCPWGNHYRLYGPDEARWGRTSMCMPYVQFDTPRGIADRIVKFYAEIVGAPGHVRQDAAGTAAVIQASATVQMIFLEGDKPQPPFDGHHVQISLVNFSGPHAKLLERGLITEESDDYQYRFVDIVDLETNQPLFKIEHEVRSTKHPMFARSWNYTLRNPMVTNRNSVPGREPLIATFDID